MEKGKGVREGEGERGGNPREGRGKKGGSKGAPKAHSKNSDFGTPMI